MATLFTKIIAGELPGRFVWRDELCVSFLTIQPLRPGHVLVVPRAEVDHWIDLEPALAKHLMGVAQSLGRGIQQAFGGTKVGMSIVGIEVPHVHIHLVPINGVGDMNFALARDAKGEELDEAAEAIRFQLRELGCPEVAAE